MRGMDGCDGRIGWTRERSKEIKEEEEELQSRWLGPIYTTDHTRLYFTAY